MFLTPIVSVNMLALLALAVVYFVVGSMHEESRLVVEFGEAYVRYRQCVPRLIPRLGCCWPPRDTSKEVMDRQDWQ